MAFLKAFMNFVATVFDDNPQTYVESDGKKHIIHQYKAPIYRLPPFDQKFDTRHDIPGMILVKLYKCCCIMNWHILVEVIWI